MKQKKINLALAGLDGKAFAILGAFQRQARREGWTKEEIDTVLTKARSGDYHHLLSTIVEHTNNPFEVYE